MAFASMLRRASSAAAIRFAGSIRHHTSAAPFFSSVKPGCGGGRQQLRRSSFPSALHFSTVTAKRPEGGALVQILEAEIQCAGNPDVQEGAADVPANFPFKIEDNPGEQIVKLTRKYDGETIGVEVYMPHLVTGDDDDREDDDSENTPQSTLPLLVKISKGAGPSLEFNCSAYPDEVNIDSLSVKDPENSDDMAFAGPDFGKCGCILCLK